MTVEFTLDAREMAPPEPFDKATAILRKLERGQYLRMLHRRVPYPLFDFCRALSLDYSVKETPAADFEIIVYHVDDATELWSQGILCE
jgi:hypothetical protein